MSKQFVHKFRTKC